MAAAAMPALVKAAPFIASGVGSLLGKKLSGPNAQQKTGMAGTNAVATQMGEAAPQLMAQGAQTSQQGNRALSQAGSYYGKLMGGDRAEMRSAMAPEIATTLDYYKGASAKTSRTMKGGSRDMALAELDRSKVGNLAMQGVMARQGAAAGMERVGGAYGSMGANMTGQGVNAGSNAGWLNNYMFNQGQQVQQGEREGGKAFGGMLFDIVKSLPMGGKKPAMPTFGGIPVYGTGF